MKKYKIEITKQDPQSDDDDFDTHVFMLRGNDDDVIIDEDDIMIDPVPVLERSPQSWLKFSALIWS